MSFQLLVDWLWSFYPYNRFLARIKNKIKSNRDKVSLLIVNRNEVEVEWIGEIHLQIELVLFWTLTSVVLCLDDQLSFLYNLVIEIYFML